MKYLVIAGKIITVISIYILFFKLVENLDQLPAIRFSIHSYLGFGLLVLSGVFNVGLSAYAWRILLRGGGVFLEFGRAFNILGRAQIAKYFPGNVFHYIGRASLGTKAGIPMENILISMGIETVFTLAVAAALGVAGVALGFFGNPTVHHSHSHTFYYLSLLVVVGGAGFLVIYRKSPKVHRWIRQQSTYLYPRNSWASAAAPLVFFVTIGLLISFAVHAFWNVPGKVLWYQYASGYALAWVVGFVVPGSPGGLGIREVILVGLFGPGLGEGSAIGLAILLRIVSSLGDLLAYIFALWSGDETPFSAVDKP